LVSCVSRIGHSTSSTQPSCFGRRLGCTEPQAQRLHTRPDIHAQPGSCLLPNCARLGGGRPVTKRLTAQGPSSPSQRQAACRPWQSVCMHAVQLMCFPLPVCTQFVLPGTHTCWTAVTGVSLACSQCSPPSPAATGRKRCAMHCPARPLPGARCRHSPEVAAHRPGLAAPPKQLRSRGGAAPRTSTAQRERN